MENLTSTISAEFFLDRANIEAIEDQVVIPSACKVLTQAGIEHFVRNYDSLTEIAIAYVNQASLFEVLQITKDRETFYVLHQKHMHDFTPHIEHAMIAAAPEIECEYYFLFTDLAEALILMLSAQRDLLSVQQEVTLQNMM